MKLNSLLYSVLSAMALLAGSAEAKDPNVVVFLVDDLGFMDIGANNPDCC